ncbi:MAG: hypothetical protein ACR2PH_08885 [Desulfobulbia bacterium]
MKTYSNGNSLVVRYFLKKASMAVGFLLIFVLGISERPADAAGTACGPYIQVNYAEDSPDYFEILNQSGEGWSLTSLKIDLRTSAGNVIFDTVAGGYGSASPFPFREYSGDVRLTGVSGVIDGGHELVLNFENFTPGNTFSFIVDLDDQLEYSEFGQAHVSDSELIDAGIEAILQGPTGRSHGSQGRFDDKSRAIIGSKGCV